MLKVPAMKSEFYKWALIKHKALELGVIAAVAVSSACSAYSYEHDYRPRSKPAHGGWRPAKHDKHHRKQKTNLWQTRDPRPTHGWVNPDSLNGKTAVAFTQGVAGAKRFPLAVR